MTGTPRSRFRHVYAIVRVDQPVSETDPGNDISVVKVLVSEAYAEKELARLNDVNASKGCVYLLMTTRLVE